ASLPTADGYSANTHYSAFAAIRDASDVDFYEIRSAKFGRNQQSVMTINVRALKSPALNPTLQVYDKDGELVDANVLVSAGGSYTVQVADAKPNADYFIKEVGDCKGAPAVGDYQLDVDLRAVIVNLRDVAAGALTNTAPSV